MVITVLMLRNIKNKRFTLIFTIILLEVLNFLYPVQPVQWVAATLHWRHNGRDSVSNHRRFDCLFNRLSGYIANKHQRFGSRAFVREFTSHRRIPLTRGKCSHLMTSSCLLKYVCGTRCYIEKWIDVSQLYKIIRSSVCRQPCKTFAFQR